MKQLESLRNDHPSCTAIALSDISSGTVLCVSSADKIPQEILDQYCQTAAELLNGAAATACANLLSGGIKQLQTATVLMAEKVMVFVRSDQEASDVIICLCDPDIDVDSLLPAVRKALYALSSGQ
ncbi:MAG: hypothetical protein ACU0C9_10955 [Paracoccaceae bacterium]